MSIKAAIEKAKGHQDTEVQKAAEEALRFQAVCQQFLDYLQGPEGREALELLSLVPNNLFLIARASYRSSWSGDSRVEWKALVCSYHSGFYTTSDSSTHCWPHWTYGGERSATLSRMTIEGVVAAVESFQEVLSIANSTSLERWMTNVEGKSIEDLPACFKAGVEWISDRVTATR